MVLIRNEDFTLVYSISSCIGMQISKTIAEFDPLFSSLSLSDAILNRAMLKTHYGPTR